MDGCLGTNEISVSDSDRGYGGALCSVCSANEGFVKEGTLCIKCSTSASTSMTVVAIVIFATVAASVVLRCIGLSCNNRFSVMMEQVGFMTQAKILIGMFQITAKLPFTLNLIYPNWRYSCPCSTRSAFLFWTCLRSSK